VASKGGKYRYMAGGQSLDLTRSGTTEAEGGGEKNESIGEKTVTRVYLLTYQGVAEIGHEGESSDWEDKSGTKLPELDGRGIYFAKKANG